MARGQAAVAKVGSTVAYELDGTTPDLTGYDDYTNVGDTPRIEVNETADITIPEGWFIEIHEPTVIELVKK